MKMLAFLSKNLIETKYQPVSTRPSNPDKYVEDVNERPVAFRSFTQNRSVFCQESLDVTDYQRLGERIAVLIAMKRGLADECGCQKENAARIYGRKKCKQFHSGGARCEDAPPMPKKAGL